MLRGAWIAGGRWGYGDAPWDLRTLARFEAEAGKGVSIVHWDQAWSVGGVPQPFTPALYEAVRRHGAIPMVDWCSWDLTAGGVPDQPAFRLADIAAGAHDAYIRAWARAAREWGKPLFLRFDHEMNGTWYPWSEARNGNGPGDYVRAWRHVHDLFAEAGATNVSWVWSPNTIHPGSLPLAGLYPGDDVVDWVAIYGYNWGTNAGRPGGLDRLRDPVRAHRPRARRPCAGEAGDDGRVGVHRVGRLEGRLDHRRAEGAAADPVRAGRGARLVRPGRRRDGLEPGLVPGRDGGLPGGDRRRALRGLGVRRPPARGRPPA